MAQTRNGRRRRRGFPQVYHTSSKNIPAAAAAAVVRRTERAEFPDDSRQGKDLRKEIPAVAFLLDAAAFTAMAIITSLSAAMPLAGTGVAWWWWPVQSALVSVLILNIALGMRVFFTPFISMCLKVPLRSAPPNPPGRPSAPPAGSGSPTGHC